MPKDDVLILNPAYRALISGLFLHPLDSHQIIQVIASQLCENFYFPLVCFMRYFMILFIYLFVLYVWIVKMKTESAAGLNRTGSVRTDRTSKPDNH